MLHLILVPLAPLELLSGFDRPRACCLLLRAAGTCTWHQCWALQQRFTSYIGQVSGWLP